MSKVDELWHKASGIPSRSTKNVLIRLFGHLKPLVAQRLVNLFIYALCKTNPVEQEHANG